MGVYNNSPQLVEPLCSTRRDEVTAAMKNLDHVPMRRFLKAQRGKKRDISEGEYKRIENFLHKLAKKQKTLLLETSEVLKDLTNHETELQVLTACYRRGNDLKLFRVSHATSNSDEWLEQFMEVMTPWAEWYESVNGASEEIYFLDTFWEALENSECMTLMLRMSCSIQELELIDGQLRRFLQPYEVDLTKSPWYEFDVADRLLQSHSWIGELMFVEQLFTPNTPLNQLLVDAVQREKALALVEQ